MLLGWIHRAMLKLRGVEVQLNSTVISVDDKGITVKNEKGEEKVIYHRS